MSDHRLGDFLLGEGKVAVLLEACEEDHEPQLRRTGFVSQECGLCGPQREMLHQVLGGPVAPHPGNSSVGRRGPTGSATKFRTGQDSPLAVGSLGTEGCMVPQKRGEHNPRATTYDKSRTLWGPPERRSHPYQRFVLRLTDRTSWSSGSPQSTAQTLIPFR
jgi:hypothetical protein